MRRARAGTPPASLLKGTMQHYTMAYQPESGKPAPTPDAIFRLLGLVPVDRPELWKLLTHLAASTASMIIIGAPSDLGATPLEVALVLRLCAAHGLSVHIVATNTRLAVAQPDTTDVRVYHTTTDFAELATTLLTPQRSP